VDKATKELKTMKADNFRWLGPYKPTDRHADDVTVAELVRLRKLAMTYREALINITKAQYNADAKDWANAALEQSGKESLDK
jgi:hypothetical protein